MKCNEKCTEIRELLSLYIDSMLDIDQMEEVKDHLATCDTCKKEYNELNQIVGLLNEVEETPIPVSFELRLKRALVEENKAIAQNDTLKSSGKKKKLNWRLINSIAAIFTVGIISVGMYNDILGIIPDKMNGSDQTEAIQNEESSDIEDSENELSLKATQNENAREGSSISAEPDSIQYGNVTNNNNFNQELNREKEIATAEEAEKQQILSDSNVEDGNQNTAGISSMPDKEEAEEYTSRELPDSNTDALNKYKVQMPIQGAERNSAAVNYYDNLIKEKLDGFVYEITNCSYFPTGEWHFNIFILKGKDGNTYNEEVLIIGRNGEIEVLYANEFMGL